MTIAIALAQINPTVGDLEGNVALMIDAAETARERAEAVVQQAAARSRKGWQPAGIRLIDLETVDADLARWSV